MFVLSKFSFNLHNVANFLIAHESCQNTPLIIASGFNVLATYWGDGITNSRGKITLQTFAQLNTYWKAEIGSEIVIICWKSFKTQNHKLEEGRESLQRAQSANY